MNPAAETAVGRGDHPLAADQIGEPLDPLGHQLRVFDHIGGVADDSWQDQFAVRQLDVLPHLPFVLVADIAGLEGIGLHVDGQHHIDDVAHRDVGRMRAVPAAPAQMETDALTRKSTDGVVQRLDPHHRELLVFLDARRRVDLVPVLGDTRVIELQDEPGVEDRLYSSRIASAQA